MVGEQACQSMGADTKANTGSAVRTAGGLLERLQCGVALDALGENGSSFGTEFVKREPASMGAKAAEQWALTQKRTLGRRRTSAP